MVRRQERDEEESDTINSLTTVVADVLSEDGADEESKQEIADEVSAIEQQIIERRRDYERSRRNDEEQAAAEKRKQRYQHFHYVPRELYAIDEVSNEDTDTIGSSTVWSDRRFHTNRNNSNNKDAATRTIGGYDIPWNKRNGGSYNGNDNNNNNDNTNVVPQPPTTANLGIGNESEKSNSGNTIETAYRTEDFEFYDYTDYTRKTRLIKYTAIVVIILIIIASILLALAYTVFNDDYNNNNSNVPPVATGIDGGMVIDNGEPLPPTIVVRPTTITAVSPPTPITVSTTTTPTKTPPSSSPLTSVPTPVPTPFPTFYNPERLPNTPVSSEAFDYIFNIVNNRAPLYQILDDSTPQGQAVSHLVSEEAVATNSTPPVQVRQRFAMLTFYFSMSPNTWNAIFDFWALAENECEWGNIVHCTQIQDGTLVVDGINLEGHGLDGTIPVEICLLPFVETLNLNGNQISGAIPRCLVDSISIKTIDLGNNIISGSLPPGILTIPTLESLEVSNNQLSGTLDSIFDGMFYNNIFRYSDSWRIIRLSLDHNRFSGIIPETLGALMRLESLRVQENDFVGSVSSLICELVFEHLLTELEADCVTTVSCACCTACM